MGFERSGYKQEFILQILLAEQHIDQKFDGEQRFQFLELMQDKYNQKEGWCEKYATALVYYDVLQENYNYIPEECVIESIDTEGESVFEVLSQESPFTSGFKKTGKVYSSTLHVSNIVNTTYYYAGTYTKYGETVDCYQYKSGDFSSDEKDMINNAFNSVHSNWTYKATCTTKYNCHSFCWIGKVYQNRFWLNDPEPFAAAAHSARSVTASSGTSATSYMTTSTVISKLGVLGVYEISLYDVYNLYSGKFYRVYTAKG